MRLIPFANQVKECNQVPLILTPFETKLKSHFQTGCFNPFLSKEIKKKNSYMLNIDLFFALI